MRICDLAKTERPRERLCSQGAGSLSDAELLAILLGAGTPARGALELAQSMIGQYSLRGLSRLRLAALEETRGTKTEKDAIAPLMQPPEAVYERLWAEQTALERLKQEDHTQYLRELLVVAARKGKLTLDQHESLVKLLAGEKTGYSERFLTWLDGFLAGTIPRHWHDDLVKALRAARG